MENLERRKYNRYRTSESAIVLMEEGIGQIVDISEGGIAIKCLQRKDCDKADEGHKIALSGSGFHLEGLPVRKVWEESSKAASTSIMIRNVGLQFGELNRNQKAQLDYFLQNCTEQVVSLLAN